eukprot:snap_masked-scaffold_80-processed-gene-0.21-mRNA-1 protein AED:1.00 eAED:1.00 QI:0/0/0/0/1/1/2/0/115
MEKAASRHFAQNENDQELGTITKLLLNSLLQYMLRVLGVTLFDLMISTYISNVNGSKEEEYEAEFNSKLGKYEDDLTDDQIKFTETSGLADTSASSAILAHHENFLGIYAEKELV